MTDDTSRVPGSVPPAQPLIDRVRARVAETAHRLDRHSRRRGTRRTGGLTDAAGGGTGAGAAMWPDREARCLRVVFHELGDTHRVHRSRTGQRVPPGLRDAARAFKQAPSVDSLTGVAAFLDKDGLLKW
jgi:hypothetical protein